METHYVCRGECGGVSDEPQAVCQMTDCSKHAQHMTPCNCSDDKHEEVREDKHQEEMEDNQ